MTSAPRVTRLRDLSPAQWKSGIAAWLGWLFDGLDMHLFTLVATPLVAELLLVSPSDPVVGERGSLIQAAFLVGWALGGAFFGRIGDLIGRTRALSLTILTYALFSGMGYLATEWWHLLLFRFLAALGIGGEWAVGASLLAETWPRSWRPWIAATLQTAVNIGILLACLAGWMLHDQAPRTIFLVGVLPALLVFWIRRAVPEPEEWEAAKQSPDRRIPGVRDLFRGEVAGVTWRVLLICGIALTAHWTFMFWQQAQVRLLPEVIHLGAAEKNRYATAALFLLMFGSILGNYLAGWLAVVIGYRRAIAAMLAAYAVAMFVTYRVEPGWAALRVGLVVIGICQGVFGLFTMALPPLFPTLLRTTGAGFCYNFGRIVSAGGVVFFGLFSAVGDPRLALFHAGFLFWPAALVALLLPDPREEPPPPPLVTGPTE